MIDSEVHEAVFYYVNDNGGNSNMPNPGDGGPGGGGILIDGGDQPTISYDDNGNLIHYKEWNYRYDAQNRLTEAWNGTTTAQFYYDGKNRQIARNINGVVRFNAWDGWELVEEYGSGLTVAKGYLQGATGVIKSWDPIYGQLYYYQDKLGSTTHVANAIGQLVESFHYDLTGTPTETSTHGVVDLYAGERWISELRLYDLRNRFMSPELGRFLQPDPIGFKGDASNLYRYCGNDPVNRSDPTGTISEVMVEGNDISIRIPMHFTGEGATPKIVAQYIDGIEKKFTGTFGPYKVTATVDTDHGLRRGNQFNDIKIVRTPGLRSETVNHKNGTWSNSGSKDMAGHEAGHDLGLRDRYKDVRQSDGKVRSVPNPRYEKNVMDNMAAPPSAKDIHDIIENKKVNDIIRVLPAQKP
jgi:RHS repeat-associated protein